MSNNPFAMQGVGTVVKGEGTTHAFQKDVDSANKKIENLRSVNKMMKDRLLSTQKESKEQKARIEELEKALKNGNGKSVDLDKMADLERQNKDMHAHVARLKADITAKDKAAHEKTLALKKEHEDAQSQVAKLQQVNKLLEERLRSQSPAIARAKDKSADDAKKMADLERQNKDMHEHIAKLKADITAKDKAAHEKTLALTKDHQDAQSQVAKLQQVNKLLEERLKSQAKPGSDATQVQKLQQVNKLLEDRLRQMKSQCDTFQKQLGDASTHIERLQKDVSSKDKHAHEQHEKTKREREAALAQVATLQARNKILEDGLQSATETKEVRQKNENVSSARSAPVGNDKFADLERQNKALHEHVEKLKMDVAAKDRAAHEKNERLKREHKEAAEKVTSLQSVNKLLEDRVSVLKQRLQEGGNRSRSNSNAGVNDKRALVELEGRFEALRASNLRLTEEVTGLRAQKAMKSPRSIGGGVGAVWQRNAELEKEIEELRATNEKLQHAKNAPQPRGQRNFAIDTSKADKGKEEDDDVFAPPVSARTAQHEFQEAERSVAMEESLERGGPPPDLLSPRLEAFLESEERGDGNTETSQVRRLTQERDAARRDVESALGAVSQWEQRYVAQREMVKRLERERDQAREDTKTALDAVSHWEGRHAAALEDGRAMQRALNTYKSADAQSSDKLQASGQDRVGNAKDHGNGNVEPTRPEFSHTDTTYFGDGEDQGRGISVSNSRARAQKNSIVEIGAPVGMPSYMKRPSLATLIALDHNNPHVHLGVGGAVSFGRSDDCTVQLGDKSISSRHARVYCEPDLVEEGIGGAKGLSPFVLEDTSSNGIFVNFVKLGKGNKHRLQHGDVIWLSKLALKTHPKSAKHAYLFEVDELAKRESIMVPPHLIQKLNGNQ